MALAILLHMLAAVIWVGGMFFAYIALRPAASLLEPAIRLSLWAQVFQRFFPWVWAAILVLLTTGLWAIFSVFGGMAEIGLHIHLMLTLGLVMILLFMHLFFSPYQQLKHGVAEQHWELAATALNKIRRLIAINLSLGLIVTSIAAAGRWI